VLAVWAWVVWVVWEWDLAAEGPVVVEMIPVKADMAEEWGLVVEWGPAEEVLEDLAEVWVAMEVDTVVEWVAKWAR
jgi:hypothetical protein